MKCMTVHVIWKKEVKLNFRRQLFDKFDEKEKLIFDSIESEFQKKRKITLGSCFELFQKQEQLDNENRWYCDQCKKHQPATKQMKICRAPSVLVLHLKRFQQVKSAYSSFSHPPKINGEVEFPLTLNMNQYILI